MRLLRLLSIVAAALLIAIAPAMADNEASGTRQYTIQSTQPPSVVAIAIYDSNDANTVTSLDPTGVYWIHIDISDAETLDDIKEIKIQFFYDYVTGNIGVGNPPSSTSSSDYIILKYTRTPGSGSGGSWEFVNENDESQGTTYGTWQILDKVDPSDWTAVSGTFKVKIKVGKVAHEAPNDDAPSADWDIKATAKDSGNNQGSNQAWGYAMTWYGEIAIASDDQNFNFGTVQLGVSRDTLDTPSEGYLDIYVVSNGKYDVNTKATDSGGNEAKWYKQGSTTVYATIVESSPGDGQMLLEVDTDNNHLFGVTTVGAARYLTWINDATGPTSDGNAVDGDGASYNAYLLLTLGSSGLQPGTYVGKVFFQVTNNA